MGKARALAGFPYAALPGPLEERARRRVARHLRGLLDWQRSLRRWPVLKDGPAATAFVSIYDRDRLVGCFGSDEGAPGDRLSRAFLRALGDTRHHAFAPADRAGLLAHVAYPIAPFRIDSMRDRSSLEPGTHGLVRIAPGGAAVLMPSVSRDGGFDTDTLLDRLADKAGVAREQLRDGDVFAFSTETVSTIAPGGDACALGRSWLADRVDARGAVTFAVDARRRTLTPTGPMHHGRAAILVAALAARGGSKVAARARARLGHDAQAALAGKSIAGWPDAAETIAGTLALLRWVDAIDDEPLLSWIERHRNLADHAWHAAQCVAALGARAPAWLWDACVRDLEVRPWAPWTLLAARRRNEASVVARLLPVIARSLAETGPYLGGAKVTAIPELALTALAVESLLGIPGRDARAAVERGRQFLRRWQLRPETLLGAHEPTLAIGAFPGSPIADLLRADITAHAVLALGD